MQLQTRHLSDRTFRNVFVYFGNTAYLKTLNDKGELTLEDTSFIASGQGVLFFSPANAPDQNADLLARNLNHTRSSTASIYSRAMLPRISRKLTKLALSMLCFYPGQSLEKLDESKRVLRVCRGTGCPCMARRTWVRLSLRSRNRGGGANRRKGGPRISGRAILPRRLEQALQLLNPSVPQGALEDAYRKLTRIDAPLLVNRNHTFQRMLAEGITVEYPRKDGSYSLSDR